MHNIYLPYRNTNTKVPTSNIHYIRSMQNVYMQNVYVERIYDAERICRTYIRYTFYAGIHIPRCRHGVCSSDILSPSLYLIFLFFILFFLYQGAVTEFAVVTSCHQVFILFFYFFTFCFFYTKVPSRSLR